MADLKQSQNECCSGDEACCPTEKQSGLQPFSMAPVSDEVCCGSPPGPQSSLYEKPGYELQGFVESFFDTAAGPVPRVKTSPERSDVRGTISARLGIMRDQYKIAPGLYGVGEPGPDSPVLVTANYKLTFDTLRRELTAFDGWILVIDTRGINVWCAAGKELFSTREVVHRIKQSQLSTVVRHNKIILPQLAATGVSAVSVKKESGFEVLWGPIQARDIQQFVADGCKAGHSMRRVTFTLPERVVLVPVELNMCVPEAVALLPAERRPVVRHQCGERTFEQGLSSEFDAELTVAVAGVEICVNEVVPNPSLRSRGQRDVALDSAQ